jgi:ABC-type enterochelin transport system permease subunit
MLVPVLALRACFLVDIPAPDTLDHLHPGLSCSHIPVHSVTHLLVVAVAAAGGCYLFQALTEEKCLLP